MQNPMRSSRAHTGVLILVLLAFPAGCSRGEKDQVSQPTAEHQEAAILNEEAKRQETPAADLDFQESAEAQPEHEATPAPASEDDQNLVFSERQETDEIGPTVIDEKQLGPPVSREKLANHPLLKELARRHRTQIEGLQVKYDHSGLYGRDGIAGNAFAYLNNKLIGEASVVRLLDEKPLKIEVEEIHYSESGQITYRGTTRFVVGNVWRSGDTPVLPGAPLSSTAIYGSKEREIFNQWPVGRNF